MNNISGKILYSSAKAVNHFRSVFYKKYSPIGENKSLEKERIHYYNKHRPFGPLPKLCYAPWTNLFFNTDGKASVCCKNTKVLMGEYPASSIHDIWFNSGVNDLRKKIQCNDVSFGCYKCRDSITQKNFSTLTSTQFDKYGLFPLSKYPRIIEFELSNRCNLECIMCSERVSSAIALAKNQNPNIESRYDQSFIHQLKEFIPHLDKAKFSGGEPFLIPIYYKIWEEIIKLNPSTKIFVQTNGTILNEEIKKMVRKLHFRINISLDSVDKNNYEFIRKNASFELTMSNIAWYGKNTTQLGILTTPFRQNWHDVPDIIRFCNKNQYHFNISPVYQPKELALWSLDIRSQDEIINFYQSESLSSGNWLEKKNKQVFQELINSIKDWRTRKVQNDNFDQDFTNNIVEQEKAEGLLVKKKFSLQAINLLMNECIENLIKTGLSSEEINTLTCMSENVRKEQYPSLPSFSIYLKLKEIKPTDILNVIRTTASEGIYKKIGLLYESIIEDYEIDY